MNRYQKINFRNIILLLLTVSLCTLSLSSLLGEEGVGQLYTTLISAQYRSGKILISFEPLRDEDATYRIYRSQKKMMNITDLQNATLMAEITADEIPLRDAPVEEGKYYYTVTILKAGFEHAHIIPYQTTTVRPLDFSPFPSIVEKIILKAGENGKLNIYFQPLIPEYRYSLFISSEQIFNITDHTPSVTAGGTDDYFSVKLEENTTYYFAVTTTNRLGVDNRAIYPGKNATLKPYRREAAKPPVVERETEEQNGEVKSREIDESKRPVNELIEDNLRSNFYQGNYLKTLEVFQLLAKDWELAASERALINFYSGQCHYYLDNYSSAIKYFILSKEKKELRDISQAWIDRCLENIE
jgi:hypothetical protein